MLSCDSGGSAIQESDFVFPLAVGNSWTYEYSHKYTSEANEYFGYPNEMESTGTLILTITDVIELSNGISTYKMLYSLTEDNNSAYDMFLDNEINYYLNNTDDGLILYASDQDQIHTEYGLPMSHNAFESELYNNIIKSANIFGFVLPYRDDCQYVFDPPQVRLNYPILLDDNWDVVYDDHRLLEVCDETEQNSNHITLPITREVLNIRSNGCFEMKQDKDLSVLADDIIDQTDYLYCNNIGLTNTVIGIDLGEQTAQDELGNHFGVFESRFDIEIELIEYNIE